MEKLKELTIAELIALYEHCSEKDEAKIEVEIERRTGFNISEPESFLYTLMQIVIILCLGFIVFLIAASCVKWLSI